jgi:mannose-1-phosphate guanylyltransferase
LKALLAAGLGTRLRPVTDKMPKCLVPIDGKPLLVCWLDSLLPNGVEQVLVKTHYLAEKEREGGDDRAKTSKYVSL